MGELKSWVRQRARPEGSMAQGYIVAETMHYVTEFSARFHPDGPKLITEGEFQKFRGIVLPKARATKVMNGVFREQAWRFLLNNTECLEPWRLLYDQVKDSTSTTPDFKDWLLPALTASIEESGRRPDPMVWDLAVGPSATGDFYTACWAYGRHFRVSSRDLNKKTTFDCGISQMFLIDGQQKEYVGYVESIVRLNFDSFETVLLKARWFDSVHGTGRNATLVEDECGHLRVKQVNFASDTSPLDEPFAFPKDVEQLFFVKDKIHKGWLLAVKVNARTMRVAYCKSNSGREESAVQTEDDGGDACFTVEQSDSRHGRRISTEADDSAGEHVDIGNSDTESGSESNDDDFSDDENTEDVQCMDTGLLGGPDSLRGEELLELASDGEMEEFLQVQRRNRLDSGGRTQRR